MASEATLRLFGHPGLRQVCAKLNLIKCDHESVRLVCNKMKDTLHTYGVRSVCAPQLGYRYRMFAMDPVFHEDFSEEKADFEQLFLSEPQSEVEFEKQSEGLNAYLSQLEHHLNHHVPYQQDLHSLQQELNNNTDSSRVVVCINPTWSPLDLDQSIFEMEESKGNVSRKAEDGSGSSLYTTLLFGCHGVRTNCNYEQCLSFPELMVKRERFNRIRAEFYNEHGDKRVCYLKSQDARSFQHECDHLDGRLMTDNVAWHDDSSVMYLDEYLRRQQILKPQIEALLAKFSVAQQDELYKVYDPMHPPCDEELIEILASVLNAQQEQHDLLMQQATEMEPQALPL